MWPWRAARQRSAPGTPYTLEIETRTSSGQAAGAAPSVCWRPHGHRGRTLVELASAFRWTSPRQLDRLSTRTSGPCASAATTARAPRERLQPDLPLLEEELTGRNISTPFCCKPATAGPAHRTLQRGLVRRSAKAAVGLGAPVRERAIAVDSEEPVALARSLRALEPESRNPRRGAARGALHHRSIPVERFRSSTWRTTSTAPRGRRRAGLRHRATRGRRARLRQGTRGGLGYRNAGLAGACRQRARVRLGPALGSVLRLAVPRRDLARSARRTPPQTGACGSRSAAADVEDSKPPPR